MTTQSQTDPTDLYQSQLDQLSNTVLGMISNLFLSNQNENKNHGTATAIIELERNIQNILFLVNQERSRFKILERQLNVENSALKAEVLLMKRLMQLSSEAKKNPPLKKMKSEESLVSPSTSEEGHAPGLGETSGKSLNIASVGSHSTQTNKSSFSPLPKQFAAGTSKDSTDTNTSDDKQRSPKKTSAKSDRTTEDVEGNKKLKRSQSKLSNSGSVNPVQNPNQLQQPNLESTAVSLPELPDDETIHKAEKSEDNDRPGSTETIDPLKQSKNKQPRRAQTVNSKVQKGSSKPTRDTKSSSTTNPAPAPSSPSSGTSSNSSSPNLFRSKSKLFSKSSMKIQTQNQSSSSMSTSPGSSPSTSPSFPLFSLISPRSNSLSNVTQGDKKKSSKSSLKLSTTGTTNTTSTSNSTNTGNANDQQPSKSSTNTKQSIKSSRDGSKSPKEHQNDPFTSETDKPPVSDDKQNGSRQPSHDEDNNNNSNDKPIQDNNNEDRRNTVHDEGDIIVRSKSDVELDRVTGREDTTTSPITIPNSQRELRSDYSYIDIDADSEVDLPPLPTAPLPPPLPSPNVLAILSEEELSQFSISSADPSDPSDAKQTPPPTTTTATTTTTTTTTKDKLRSKKKKQKDVTTNTTTITSEFAIEPECDESSSSSSSSSELINDTDDDDDDKSLDDDEVDKAIGNIQHSSNRKNSLSPTQQEAYVELKLIEDDIAQKESQASSPISSLDKLDKLCLNERKMSSRHRTESAEDSNDEDDHDDDDSIQSNNNDDDSVDLIIGNLPTTAELLKRSKNEKSVNNQPQQRQQLHHRPSKAIPANVTKVNDAIYKEFTDLRQKLIKNQHETVETELEKKLFKMEDKISRLNLELSVTHQHFCKLRTFKNKMEEQLFAAGSGPFGLSTIAVRDGFAYVRMLIASQSTNPAARTTTLWKKRRILLTERSIYVFKTSGQSHEMHIRIRFTTELVIEESERIFTISPYLMAKFNPSTIQPSSQQPQYAAIQFLCPNESEKKSWIQEIKSCVVNVKSPLAKYELDDRNSLLSKLIISDFRIATAIVEYTADSPDSDDIVSLVLLALESQGELYNFLQHCVMEDIDRTKHLTGLFRQNTVESRILKVYCNRVGSQYLNEVIKPNVESIIANNKEMEVFEHKLKDKSHLESNRDNVREAFLIILDQVLGSAVKIPSQIQYILHLIAFSVRSKFRRNDIVPHSTGFFFFLRFICPVIIHYSTLPTTPTNIKRGLLLITKLLQTLSNNVFIGSKEQEMKAFNTLLYNNRDKYSAFVEQISAYKHHEPPPPPSTQSSSTMSQKSYELLKDIIISISDKLEPILYTAIS
eukprot:TRINITY_DN1846_c0_g2_i1.p1 TRINITY_DN1846_c0_g2~~TRINITY_DN1846_c0_g2_i1.p1  ORF type:complete len:1328 (-),score=429.30 TRINITY_DN1846_c0_g2_i1:178-4161(-)